MATEAIHLGRRGGRRRTAGIWDDQQRSRHVEEQMDERDVHPRRGFAPETANEASIAVTVVRCWLPR